MRPVLARRSLLRLAAFCPLCATAACAVPAAPHVEADAHVAHGPPHWGYEGANGPGQWGELSADFRTCAIGTEQTPIDLHAGIRAQTGKVDFAYHRMPLAILNNGHTIQVNAPPGNRVVLAGAGYELVQFHFHHPSEHLLAGKALDLECHFVHRGPDGGLAVVGVFFQPGAANAGLAPIWRAMPTEETAAKPVEGVMVDPAALLPKDRTYFRYMGSLTTPPCSEAVTWTVFRSPLQASPDQIRQFAALFPANARPVQPLNHRFLLESRA